MMEYKIKNLETILILDIDKNNSKVYIRIKKFTQQSFRRAFIMKWFIEYFGSIVGMVVSGFVFLIVLYNLFTGFGMNWFAFIVSGSVLVGSAWLNTAITE